MRIIVIILAMLLAGCYDSCYDKNFDAHYTAHAYYIDRYEDGKEVCNTKTEMEMNAKYNGYRNGEPLFLPKTRTSCYTPQNYDKPILAKYTDEQRKWNAHQYASNQCSN